MAHPRGESPRRFVRVEYSLPVSEPITAPYGTWASPITARLVVSEGLRLGFVSTDGDDVYWVEGRPQEGGRSVLVRRGADGRIEDVTPPEFNVRTRVHEYGGGAYAVAQGTAYCSNFSDQRVYRLVDGLPAEPLTPAGDSSPGPSWFYADYAVDLPRQRLLCVREDHTRPDREPVNTIVSLPLAGAPSEGRVIASGFDFYSTPRLSPDGSTLAWLSWRHPNMPWDGTELWVARIAETGDLEQAVLVAGGSAESIYQPGWSPDGTLYFVSDRDGWWRLYRRSEGNEIVPVLAVPPANAEFGRPQWQPGSSTWAFAGRSRMVVSYTERGVWHLGAVDVARAVMTSLASSLEPSEWIATTGTNAVLVAGSPTTAQAVVSLDLATGGVETLRSASSLQVSADYLSVPTPIEFPTTDGATAHAFYYAPANKDFQAPQSGRPPLIVVSHGGPTAAARDLLDLHVQYWTSRGFAVVDVNYGGSSGFGRPYRERLNGQWGIVDVADTVNAARFLVSQGRADERRMIIRGGSAGGYTTLAALTFYPGVFKAGASYYGVSDLEVLAQDTHKFESRYFDSLIGPYPAMRDVYHDRSPIHFADRLSCALILFQGLEDKVVPPNQSQMMADVVRAKGLPVAYLAFEGEQHGFRKAETTIRCLEAELFFYGAVFGFTPADAVPPVAIQNLNKA